MLFCPRRLFEFQKKLAEMLARTAMTGIDRQRLLKVTHGRPKLAQSPMSVSDIIQNIGVARVPHRRELERPNGVLPVTPCEGSFAGREIRVERGPLGFRSRHCYGAADRPVIEAEFSCNR